MPSWTEILVEAGIPGSSLDAIRQNYLGALTALTGRNVIAYYSAWLQKPNLRLPQFSITDGDLTGFMTAIHKLDRSKGLDLILHTPGGEINATEALVTYLRYAFPNNIRVIVPHQAMSAGTMIALASNEVVMGMHSSLGPIDPQVMGAPAHAILEEFETARRLFKENPHEAAAYRPILERYTPTLLGACQKAIAMADNIVKEWLVTGMFAGEKDGVKKASSILKVLGSHKATLNHGRHMGFERVKALGLRVTRLEDFPDLQNAVLSVHHAYTITLSKSSALNIVENQLGARYVNQMQVAAPVTPTAP